MDHTVLHSLQNLLRLPGSIDDCIVQDTSVLSCGCLVSESQFLAEITRHCPSCRKRDVYLLKPVLPMRSLYQIVNLLKPAERSESGRISFAEESSSIEAAQNITVDSSRRTSKSTSKVSSSPPDLDLLGLFCKFAKEEQQGNMTTRKKLAPTSVSTGVLSETTHELREESPVSPSVQRLTNTHDIWTSTRTNKPQNVDIVYEEKLVSGLDENEERNFSKCFPFHRKVTSFATQQGKTLFSSRSLINKISRFTGSAISTHFDIASKSEVTRFVLISDKKWELYSYTSTKPTLLACGRSSSEYGPSYGELNSPKDEGLIVHNDFSEKKSDLDSKSKGSDLPHRLKSWVQLHCCLSERFLVISGTKGMMRVLNVDPMRGNIGQPVYTYMIDFPIRCIALAPSNELLACGITTKEKMTGKQQPFVILHQIIDTDRKVNSEKAKSMSVSPITITVPYRDPLKILTFNSSSTHLLCCTVYEMRYFVIRLCEDRSLDYKKPRLIFSDTRLARKQRSGRGPDMDESTDRLESLLGTEDDDQMLDNEGITDIKFGFPFTNTIVITSSSLKNKPSVVLKINGPSLDSRRSPKRLSSGEIYQSMDPLSGPETSEDDENTKVTDVDVLMKVHEIGSNIYSAEVSPRGDSILFVDKSGRLLLVATKIEHRNFNSSARSGSAVVLLGEVSPALRYTESASVCFSSDGGKVMTIDRKGIFQVFDFTKGVPGKDPEVIKCKIISVR